MKTKTLLFAYFLIIIFTFVTFTSFLNFSTKPVSKPIEKTQSTSQTDAEKPDSEIARNHGGGHHGGGRHGGGHRGGHHGRGYWGPGVDLEFDFGRPRDNYYYYYRDETTINRDVSVYCEVFDEANSKVTELQVAGSLIHPAGDGTGYSFTLRPGYYTIKWRVKTTRLIGEDYQNYTKTITVSRDLEQVYVRIKGASITVKYTNR